MANLDKLESAHKLVEENAFEYRYLIQISELYQNLRDQMRDQGDNETAQLAQYEMDAFNLMSSDGQLGPQFHLKDQDGQDVYAPDITKFSTEQLDYYEMRLKKADSQRLAARYAHILWQSPKKRQQYANTAVKAYLAQLPQFETQAKSSTDDSLTTPPYGLMVVECVECALHLTVASQTDVQPALDEVWRLLNGTLSGTQFKHTIIDDLIALLLKNRKRLEDQGLDKLGAICQVAADQLKDSSDFHGAIRINELGQKVDQVTRQTTADWNRRIAACYETLMDQREKSPIVASTWCQHAIDYYRAAGDHVKEEELTRKREQLGGDIVFQTVSTTIDQTDHIARCEKIGKELAELSTDELLECIAADPKLLPLKEDMELCANETAKNATLLSLIAETVMDDRMHVAEHVSTPDEKLKRGILEAFKFYLKIEKVPLIEAIMYNGSRSEKLNAEKVLKSIGNLSWIGATLKNQRGSNKDYSYCWLDQLGPSIRAYFTYMESLLEGAEPDESPIMAIDSLTMKFEGLVRDFAQLNRILTHYDTKDKAGRTITREKDLSQLLYDPRIADLFNPDDLLFFKFLFVEQSGFSLRHRVAHSLMLIGDYNFGILQLLFVALMRLARYRPPDLSTSST